MKWKYKIESVKILGISSKFFSYIIYFQCILPELIGKLNGAGQFFPVYILPGNAAYGLRQLFKLSGKVFYRIRVIIIGDIQKVIVFFDTIAN